MRLEELEERVITKPGVFFGSLDVRGLKEMIFFSLWELCRKFDELKIELYINISVMGISVMIKNTDKVFNKIFESLDFSLEGYRYFYASLVPTKYAIVHYDNNRYFKFDSLEQLNLFQNQYKNITSIEYFIDYSFFKEIVERDKLFFDLKGKAQVFSAINNKCKVVIKDDSSSLITECFYPGGLDDYLREIDIDRTTACYGMIFSSSGKKEFGKYNFSMKVHHTGPAKIVSFVNGHKTCDGGTHTKGVEASIRRFSSQIAHLKTTLSEKKRFNLPRFLSYTAIISVFMDNCSWEGAVKERLMSEEAFQLVYGGIYKSFEDWTSLLLNNLFTSS